MNTAVDGSFLQIKDALGSSIDIKSLITILQNLTQLMQSSDSRKLLNPSHWEEISNLTKIGASILLRSDYSRDELEFIADIFRFLRNSCGGSTENQHFVLKTAEVFNFAIMPLNQLLLKDRPEEITILKICIQLFGNILVCNESSKPIVWKLFFEKNIFKNLLNSQDHTVVEYTMMVLYNCMSEENYKQLLGTEEGRDIVLAVTNTLLKNNTDWGMLFVEYLLKKGEFLDCCYNRLPLENRLLILDIISEHLKCAENEENVFISIASIEYIKNHFIQQVQGIAKLSNVTNCNMEPSEFVRMLSLLCSASVCNAYIPFMLSKQDLLKNCVETLKCIHLLGKQSSNAFSTVSTAKQTNNENTERMANHPLYGFKKDLIRLIGNLCYGCKENQDLVRTLDGIPLVLDCCKLDAKNPYIMQWCVLAIRNIMEHNQENQKILASITTNGEVVDSSLLKEIGIQVRVIDGKMTLN